MLITDLTFMAILKKLVSSVIGNRKAFCQNPQTTPRTSIQTSTSGVSPTVTHVVATETSTSLPPTTSQSSHLLLVQEVPHTQLIPVEVPFRLEVRQ